MLSSWLLATGCYAIAYGPMFPTPTVDLTLAPTRFELRSEIDTTVHGDTARLVSAVPRESVRGRSVFRSEWRRISPDSISIFWDPGTLTGNMYLGGQTRFALSFSPDTLRGIAEMQTDQIPFYGEPWAKVLAVRVPCDASDSATWRTTAAALSRWAASQPLDTALGVRRAIASFDRLRRADRGVGPTLFSNLIRAFYAAHHRCPRSTREIYPTPSPSLGFLPPDLVLRDTSGAEYHLIAPTRKSGEDCRL